MSDQSHSQTMSAESAQLDPAVDMDTSSDRASQSTAHGMSFKVGERIARGTFCDVFIAIALRAQRDREHAACADDQNTHFVMKTFPIYRQFARTMRASRAITSVDSNAREFIEDVIDHGSSISLKANSFMPTMTPYTIMPQYTIRLSDHIKQRIERYHEGLPGICILRFARRLFSALDILERARVIHGDITPRNIMLRGDTSYNLESIESFDPVLCDFGSSRIVSRDEEDCAPASIGTVPFIAPEVLLGQSFSFGADIWSAMVTIFTAITGDNLIDVYDDCELSYDVNLDSIRVHDRDDDSDDDRDDDSDSDDRDDSDSDDDRDSDDRSSSDDDPSSGEDVTYDLQFDMIYAHIVLMYRVIGAPPSTFCDTAQSFYHNGVPRYTDVAPGSITEFLQNNYKHLNVRQMQEIDHFLSLGLRYMSADRANARAILTHPFLRT